MSFPENLFITILVYRIINIKISEKDCLNVRLLSSSYRYKVYNHQLPYARVTKTSKLQEQLVESHPYIRYCQVFTAFLIPIISN